ncbi:hypothetical protein MKK84_15205 [Methylobacterium sp. E-065]|uniref:hypothetical protein n=1 Tax=Methylobacterium sp. E-065 TaxID=2836583 RepID=UPI001FB9A544|nr:hypothetical protein [Methylobacterium sp. E-065]MCJ2018770.1 hypothetical protein [Methylobacterium sp. E-065]
MENPNFAILTRIQAGHASLPDEAVLRFGLRGRLDLEMREDREGISARRSARSKTFLRPRKAGPAEIYPV